MTPAAPGYPDQPSVLAVAPGPRLAARKAWRLAAENRRPGSGGCGRGRGRRPLPRRRRPPAFALMATPATARDRVVFAAARDFGFINLDEAGQRATAGREHAAASWRRSATPSCRSRSELALQLQSRDAVGVGCHQISRPGGQWQFGVMHDGSGGDRGLATAAGAFIGPGLGLQPARLYHHRRPGRQTRRASASLQDIERTRPHCRSAVGTRSRSVESRSL